MIRNLLFIGDSITEGFENSKLLPEYNTVNKGFSGDSTFETITRIEPDWFDAKPDLIFICIGTNDLARDINEDVITSNIKSIVKKIRSFYSDGKIILIPLFPTRDNPARPNKLIDSLNLKIKYLSDELRVGFFNTHPHFTDEEGKLKKEFTDDGLHLTLNAYEHWAKLTKTFLEYL